MNLTKTFTAEQYSRGLAFWSWIGLDGKTPVLASLFGDVFLSSSDGYWFLDTMEGSLDCLWATRADMDAELATQDGEDRYLLGALAVAAASRRGLVLEPDQVYVFVPHPLLSRRFDVDTIMTQPFVVALCISGQLHEQTQ